MKANLLLAATLAVLTLGASPVAAQSDRDKALWVSGMGPYRLDIPGRDPSSTVLNLGPRGQARLNQPGKVPATSTGSWTKSGSRVTVTLKGIERFVFVYSDQTLRATSWDRDRFGSIAPVFKRGMGEPGRDRREVEQPAIRRFSGAWNRDDVKSREERWLLTLDTRGGATLAVTHFGLDSLRYRGTWRERNDRAVVHFTSLDGRRIDESIEFRYSSRGKLVSTSWDKREFGRSEMVFERTRGR